LLRAVFFVRYLFAELGRRRGRTVLTALGLAVGVALVIVVNALSSGLDRAQAQVLEPLTGLGTDISVTRPLDLGSGGFQGLSDSERQQLRDENGGGRIGLRDLGEPGTKFSRDTFVSGQLSIPAEEVSSVRALDGVQDAAGSLTLNALHIEGTVPEQGEGGFRGQAPAPGGGPDSIDTQSMTVTGLDVTRPELAPVSAAEIESGRYLSKANEAVLNVGYARRNDLAIGDTITLGGAKLKVVGLAKPPLGGQASDVYVSLAKLQQLSDRTGRVNAINVRADSSDDVAAVTSAIEGQLDGASVTTAADVAKRVSGSLVDAQNLSGKLGAALVVIGLGAAFLIAILLTLASVTKRTRELGTLKALGWSQRLVVRQVTGEALLQGVLGAALGVALGLLGAVLLDAYGPTLTATVAATAQQEGPRFIGAFGQGAVEAGSETVTLDAPVDASVLALAVALALAGGLVAGAAGAFRASRLRPADALRHVD
jgi:ABC-type antimicrobial peptide transport system permease subunit